MTLDDIFKQLAVGELQHTGDVENGIVKPASYQRLANHVELALLDLFTRFPLKERELILDQDDNTTFYHLHSRHALSTGDNGEQKYINDTNNPFTDDIIAIQSIWNEDGSIVPLNDSTCNTSIFSPAPTTLQIMEPVTGNSNFIIYRAAHPSLGTVTDPTTVSIDVPANAMTAILAYVANRAYSSNQSKEAQVIASQYLGKYELACTFLQKHISVNNVSDLVKPAFEINQWP